MVRTLPPIALVVGVAFAPVCARAQSQLSLKSVSVARFFGARVATETRGSVYVSALDLRSRRQFCVWAVAALLAVLAQQRNKIDGIRQTRSPVTLALLTLIAV